MPFANRKFDFIGSFQFSIVRIQRISSLRKPELFRHFSKLKIACFNEKILPISLKLNFTLNILGGYGLKASKLSFMRLELCRKDFEPRGSKSAKRKKRA